MKKIVAFILTLVMIFSLAACGGDKQGTGKTSKKLDYANMTADDLLKDIKDQQNVTLDEFMEYHNDEAEDQEEQIMGILNYLTEWVVHHILYVDGQIPKG